MKIRLLWIDTGYAGAEYEDDYKIDDAEWQAMSEQEQQEFLEDLAEIFLNNHIDYGAAPVAEDCLGEHAEQEET